MNTESNIIKEIKSGNQKTIEMIYIQHKKEFLVFASRLTACEEEALDIYQDSIVTMYENIVSGKLTTLTSSLKTYLFAIGKYKLYSIQKVKSSTERLSDYEFHLKQESEDDFLVEEENVEKIQKAYQQLGNKCKEVLKLFYYENYSIEEIKDLLDYTSKDVVKSQKSRCIKHLKELLLKLR